jgi:putative hydrolase of the HAD superfamily
MEADRRRETGIAPARESGSRSREDPLDGLDSLAPARDGEARSGLLIDWGGVLTTSLFASFKAYCQQVQIDPQTLVERFSRDPASRELLIALEKGELQEPDFELRFAALLGVDPEGLVDGLFAGVEPDPAMVDAVRRAREGGVRTALVSNSWGVHRYPHDLLSEIFDGIVISGEERIRKPSRRMYELGAERAGAPAELCVYVDDLPFNLPPAEKLGMATVHHTSADTTIPELERLIGLSLG